MARLTDSMVTSIKPPSTGQVEHADDLVRGLRLRVGAGGRKAWIVRARAGGKPINRTLGPYPALSLARARDDARKLLTEIATNGDLRKQRAFGELVDHWIENVAKPNNRSWKLQLRRLEMYALPAWKGRSLDTIRRSDVRDLLSGITGDVTPNRVLTTVRTLFRYAMSQDWIEASPAEAIDKPNKETSRDRVLDMAEIKRVYAAADLLGYPASGFLKTLLLTAQRRTEVASMRWEDIDLDTAVWTIPAADNKSDRKHLVPLSAAAVAVLRSAPKVSNYVWANARGGHVAGYSAAKTRLDTFLSADGGKLKPWRFHDARRSAATHMVRLGVAEAVVSRVLNHAAQGVTARVYALHSYAPEKRAALEQWAADLERGTDGGVANNLVAMRS